MNKVRYMLNSKLRRVGLLDIKRKIVRRIRRVLYYLNVFAFIHLFLFTVFARLNLKIQYFMRISRNFMREYLKDDILIYIKLDKIRYDWDRIHGLSNYVENSCWDEEIKPIQILKSVQQIFVEKLDYKQTDQYLKMKKTMEAGEYWNCHDCETLEDIDQYFEGLQKIYINIKDQGFKTQRELGKLGYDDVKVMIDRSGNLLLGPGGNHRFAIAKILKIKTIPVLVDSVHYNWAKECLLKYGGSFFNAIKLGLRQYDCRSEKSIPTQLSLMFKVKCVLSSKLRRVGLLDIKRKIVRRIRRVLYYLNVFAFIHLFLFTVVARLNLKSKYFTSITRKYGREYLKDDLLIYIKLDQIRYDWDRMPDLNNIVENSCWDEEKKPIQPLKSVQQLFVEKIDYKQTDQYLEMKKTIEAGEYWNCKCYSCESLEDIDHYFEELLKAYQSIKDQGFKTQRELGQLRYDDHD